MWLGIVDSPNSKGEEANATPTIKLSNEDTLTPGTRFPPPPAYVRI